MNITVAIPVGPMPHHAEWLDECLASVRAQTRRPDEILLIDDMHDIDRRYYAADTRVWRAPWRLGVPAAFNAGVALARNNCVFMLGADDTLEPECLELCAREWEIVERSGEADPDLCWYYVAVRYMGGEQPDQFLPCNSAMVTRTLWRATGGFPAESSVGSCDSMLISMFWNRPSVIRFAGVAAGKILCNYRVGNATESGSKSSEWQGPVFAVRDLLTRGWSAPAWGRFEP